MNDCRSYISPVDCVEKDVKKARAASPYYLLILGWTEHAFSILTRQIVDAQLGAGEVPHVSVLCEDAAEKAAEFKKRLPAAGLVSAVTFVECEEDDDSLLSRAKSHFFGVNCILVATADEERATRLVPHVCRAVEEFFGVPFDKVFVACAETELPPEHEDFVEAAKHIHALYEAQKLSKNPDYVKKQWDELSQTVRDVNVDATENMRVKLRLVGLNSKKQCDEVLANESTLSAFLGKARLEQLGKQEHERWNAFYVVRGWVPMSRKESDARSEKAKKRITKDEAERKHICLVDWDGLDELDDIDADYKKYDVDNVLRIPFVYSLFFDLLL